jgi:hypothetical protein
MKNTLFLECRGCYFFESDRINTLSDVGNYRVGVYRNQVTAADGRKFILEFGSYTKYKTRYTNKRTGKPLMHPVRELVLENALHVNTEFDNERGSWADLALEKKLNDMNLTYTKENILKVVNTVSVKQFDCVVMVSSEKVISKIDSIYKNGGFRERSIINNLVEIRTSQYTKDYWVLRFIASDGSYFEYEYNSNRITG